MNLKAKIQAAASRAANGPGDPTKKSVYKAPTTTMPAKGKEMSGGSKEKYTSSLKRKSAPMQPMTTLRPTSVSVSVEKRTPAPLAGQALMGKTKKRG